MKTSNEVIKKRLERYNKQRAKLEYIINSIDDDLSISEKFVEYCVDKKHETERVLGILLKQPGMFIQKKKKIVLILVILI